MTDKMVKMVVTSKKRADLTLEQFYAYWRGPHAELITRLRKDLRIHRYVQSHRIADPGMEEFGRSRGWGPQHDGLAELWWESQEIMAAAFASPEGQRAAAELALDDARFCENGTGMSVFLAREHEIF